MITNYPRGIFPPTIEDYINQLAKSSGFCIDYMFGTITATLSSLIGARYNVEINKGWHESPLVWVGLVGKSGIKKTPAMKSILFPVYNYDAKRAEEYGIAKDLYKKAQENGEKELEIPISKQQIIDDVTIESLFSQLKKNPGGLLLKKDELIGMIEDFNKYSKSGGEEARYLSMFSGDPILLNRKTNDDYLFIKNPFVSILGGFQPKVFKLFAGGNRSDNGFIMRFLFYVPHEDYKQTVPNGDYNIKLTEKYENYIMRFTKLDEEEPFDSISIPISEEGSSFFNQWRKSVVYPHINGDNEQLGGYYSKIEAYAVRLALIIEFAWSMEKGKPPISISLQSMKRAIDVCEYHVNCYLKLIESNIKVTPNRQIRIESIKSIFIQRTLELKSKNEIVIELKKQYTHGEITKATGIAKSTISFIINKNGK